MRRSIVPAQITTVEDRVAGSLTLSQLLLLTTPIFVGGAVFAFVPPLFGTSISKIIIVVLVALFFSLMAIRVKGKILLLWFVILARYNFRPKYYVYDKNDMYMRALDAPVQDDAVSEQPKSHRDMLANPATPEIADIVALKSIVDNPKANFHIRTTRRGVLSVRVTEIK